MFSIPLFLGFIVGLVSSILGLGGGILLVPLLPLVTDLSRKESVFVSLTTIFFIVSVNSYSFYKSKKMNMKSVLTFGPMTGLGSLLAALVISPYFSNNDLRITLAVVLMVWGVLNVFKMFRRRKGLSPINNSGASLSKSQLLHYICLALIAGMLSGLLGIGSGLILSLVLVGLSWVKDDEISPSSNGIMVFTTFFAALVYLFKSPSLSESLIFLKNYTMPLVLGAVISSYFGRKYQHLLSRQWRAFILIGLLFSLSLRTFFSQ